ncbi:MAG: hypothetical protein QM708_08475 [Propioniciclava sp.]|uniref:hypothetical protein n=1 Tax=Propioniciclava sp. TaxID=2038686 RepID=UPI0039E65C93
MTPEEARKSLDDISETKRFVAQRARPPRGYYAVVGIGPAAAILSFAFHGSLQYWLLIAGFIPAFFANLWLKSATGTWTATVLSTALLKEWPVWILAAVFGAGLISAVIEKTLLVALIGAAATLLAFAVVGLICGRGRQEQVVVL